MLSNNSAPINSLSETAAYVPRRQSQSVSCSIRGLKSAVRIWPALIDEKSATRPTTLLLLHGWMDVAASFQFLVDQLPDHYRCVSFDWRGFGDSQHCGVDSYWFADYVGDLEAFIDYSQACGWLERGEPINLVAHSMGGNIAMIYSGIRPERVRRLVNLEGTGLPASKPSSTPARYRGWLDEIKSPPTLRAYASFDDVAARLQKTNPRLRSDFALYLAKYWAKPVNENQPEGAWQLNSDPLHKVSNPILYRVEEVLACWRGITAPVLLALASDTNDWHQFIKQAAYQRRLSAVRNITVVTVAETGHMMHHDQPVALAELLVGFIGAPDHK